MGLFFGKPTDYGAMPMDDLLSGFKERRAELEKLKKKKKQVDKVAKNLNTADKTLKTANRLKVFERLGNLFGKKSEESESTETTEE